MNLDPTQLADWQIAEAAQEHMKPIEQIAIQLGIQSDELIPKGEGIAKIDAQKLWTRIQDRPTGKYIDITAITPTPLGEGKTTTVANLAITFANLGKKTLLVDTDLRRPVVHSVFNVKREPGVTNYLSGLTDEYLPLVKKSEIENLSLLTSGLIPPNPSEILGTKRMSALVKKLESDWDMVLFDSPPLVAVTDATMISKEIDSIILVIKAGQTDKKAFHHTMANLKNINAPLDGIVMNAVTSKSNYGSYYYYYYHQYYHYYSSHDNQAEG